MWQQAVIGLVVLLAAGYVVWSFMTMRAQQRFLDACAARGWLTHRAAKHRARMATPGCSNCSAAGATGESQARSARTP